jgi:biopolymer transport protein ExbB
MGVLAAIAPLMGLLGTVTGMINIFRVITVVGTGDPRVMSGGISEALLTTQFGLAVAIPLMIIHHMLERRVDRIVGDMEEKGTAFAVTLMKQGAIKEKEAQSV